MIRQPEYGSRNVNDMFYAEEGRRIRKINKFLAGVELTKEEERTLIWLAGWDASIVDNMITVMEKAANVRANKMVQADCRRPPEKKKCFTRDGSR